MSGRPDPILAKAIADRPDSTTCARLSLGYVQIGLRRGATSADAAAAVRSVLVRVAERVSYYPIRAVVNLGTDVGLHIIATSRFIGELLRQPEVASDQRFAYDASSAPEMCESMDLAEFVEQLDRELRGGDRTMNFPHQSWPTLQEVMRFRVDVGAAIFVGERPVLLQTGLIPPERGSGLVDD